MGFLGAYRDPGGLDPLTAGLSGSVLTTWVTYVPCFLFIFVGAPYIESLRRSTALRSALSAITAAVVGVMLNLAVWFSIQTLFGAVGEVRTLGMHILVPDWGTVDLGSVAIAVVSAVAILRFRVGMLATARRSSAGGLGNPPRDRTVKASTRIGSLAAACALAAAPLLATDLPTARVASLDSAPIIDGVIDEQSGWVPPASKPTSSSSSPSMASPLPLPPACASPKPATRSTSPSRRSTRRWRGSRLQSRRATATSEPTTRSGSCSTRWVTIARPRCSVPIPSARSRTVGSPTTDGHRSALGRDVALRRHAPHRSLDGGVRDPVEALRFSSSDDRAWGVNVIRTLPRRLETSLWSGPAESLWRVSRFGSLEGLELPRREEKAWQLIPYALATADASGETNFDAGGDFRWRPSTRIGVDLTANPDFALIEADVETINLTRFELEVPEKRPFFLEGGEMYYQRIRQFYSRRIGDISWGAKSTGSFGQTDMSAIITSEDLDLDGFGARRLRDPATAARPPRRLQYRLAGCEPAPRRRRGGLVRPRHDDVLHRDPRSDRPTASGAWAHQRRRPRLVRPPGLRLRVHAPPRPVHKPRRWDPRGFQRRWHPARRQPEGVRHQPDPHLLGRVRCGREGGRRCQLQPLHRSGRRPAKLGARRRGRARLPFRLAARGGTL